MGRGQLSHLILDDSEHLSDCLIDSASKLVLVIDHQPLVQDYDDVWLEDLRDL